MTEPTTSELLTSLDTARMGDKEIPYEHYSTIWHRVQHYETLEVMLRQVRGFVCRGRSPYPLNDAERVIVFAIDTALAHDERAA